MSSNRIFFSIQKTFRAVLLGRVVRYKHCCCVLVCTLLDTMFLPFTLVLVEQALSSSNHGTVLIGLVDTTFCIDSYASHTWCVHQF